MDKHTPGPWETKTMNDGSRNVIADNEFICEFSNIKGNERAKQEANGCLIAAAPDLLAALQKFALKHRHTYGLDGAWDEEITMAENAIAKATGKQS